KRRGASMTIEQQTLADMAEGDSITIRAGHKPITFAPLGLARAQKVVDKCQADLLRSWGVDPQERIAVATPETRLSHGAWINSGDYPSGAINQASIGDTTILYTIGTEGAITDCRIVGRSGTPELDAAACAAITKRGRFRPALDAAGKPLVTHETRRINWRMPR
ncbi:MAG: energy transducer TonB, partial [Sphingomonas sp.]